MVTEITSETFEKDVLKMKGLFFVDFYADWCGPCKVTAPIIEDISDSDSYKTIKFGKINVDDHPSIAVQYNVISIPTCMLFKDGEPVDHIVGVRDKKGFEEILKKHL
jgi:thioredoxin 1